MSQLTIQQPIQHIPSFSRWQVDRYYAQKAINAYGFEQLYPGGVHNSYCYTDIAGMEKLRWHLLFKSDLYKPGMFTCINYAYKVWLDAATKYNINTWVPVIGRIPNYEPRHAWILIMTGGKNGFSLGEFFYFEPNDGWDMGMDLEMAGQVFPIGEAGYKGEFIFF